jgi:putative transposase
MSAMGRPLRPVADGLVYHAINRGNNRGRVFIAAVDYRAFVHALAQTQLRYPFRLYGYCLMSNHFHLLLGPAEGQSISRILQSLTVAHTWRYHRRHTSSGHVWQGRFKSPVIQTDEHALTVLRYIEGNPLRAGMVKDLADYPWSSYHCHALGQSNPLVEQLPCWNGLGATEPARQAYWRTWIHTPLSERELTALRRSVVSGVPFGSSTWVEKAEKMLGLRKPSGRPRGRPRKIREA